MRFFIAWVACAAAGTAATATTTVVSHDLPFSLPALAVAPSERAFLLSLHDATQGASWHRSRNWLRGDPCLDEWEHVVCRVDPSTGRNTIVELGLRRNNLAGRLPEFADTKRRRAESQGTYLALLHLNTQRLPDGLSNEFVKPYLRCQLAAYLPHLERLDLAHNTLQGSISATIGCLRALRFLDLSTNHLTGAIPKTIGNLAHLRVLSAHVNSLAGPLPDSLGKLSTLEYLSLHHNSDLISRIPQSFSGLAKLEFLVLSRTHLYGVFPDMTRLKNLRHLEITHTLLSGMLPTFSPDAPLTTIDLSHNLLTGDSLAALAALPTLRILNLANNLLTLPDGVPRALCDLQHIAEVNVADNPLHSHAIPQWLRECAEERVVFQRLIDSILS